VSLIGLVSDTHLQPRGGAVALPPALLRGLSGVAAILHAGDIACREVLDVLGGIAPVHAVCGNVDSPGLGLPVRLLLEFDGVEVGLTHGHLGAGRTTPDRARRAFPRAPSVVVFGHSHRPLIQRIPEGPLLVNPGSPTQPRGRAPTFALLQVCGDVPPSARLIPL